MTTTALALLLAAWLQGLVALVLLFVMGSIRLPMVGAKAIAIKDIALSREPWPEHEKRVSNAFDNQFQLPVLFYVAVFAALYLTPTWFEALTAWIFVLSRVAHAAIFAINNNVVRRFTAFVIGLGALCALWLDLAVRLVLTALGNS